MKNLFTLLLGILLLSACVRHNYPMKHFRDPVEYENWDGQYKIKYYSLASVVLVEYEGEVKGYVFTHKSDKVFFLPKKDSSEVKHFKYQHYGQKLNGF